MAATASTAAMVVGPGPHYHVWTIGRIVSAPRIRDIRDRHSTMVADPADLHFKIYQLSETTHRFGTHVDSTRGRPITRMITFLKTKISIVTMKTITTRDKTEVTGITQQIGMTTMMACRTMRSLRISKVTTTASSTKMSTIQMGMRMITDTAGMVIMMKSTTIVELAGNRLDYAR